MAQKKKTNKSKAKIKKRQFVINISGLSIPKQKLIKIGGIVIVLILLVWFVNSSFWPWPSSVEIGRRLNEVIDACMYNERSRGCSAMQEKYRMSFEYCHSLADIPEIDKKVPIYGVAKKNDMNTREISYRDGDKTLNKYPYYSCTSYVEDAEKDSGPNLLSSEPSTMALFALYKTPKYSTSGNYSQCHVTLDPGYNFLWDQIPNIETVKNKYEIAFNTYNKCGQLSDLQRELDVINTKLSSYSSNKTVQQFYKIYGDWGGDMEKTSGYHLTCNFMNKSFVSNLCGATTGPNSANNLESFSSEMRSYMSTDDFTSKIVVTD